MPLVLRALVLVLLLAGAAGCRLVGPSAKSKSPLVPLVAAPDAVTLEIFSAPMPLGDPRLAALWAQVDEQSLAADLRQRLAQNGLQVGIVGPHLPDALADLLKITGEPISAEERTLVPIDSESEVTLNVMQPRAGKRGEQVVSQSYEQMALLQNVGGEVQGRRYYKAEGRMALRVFPEASGRVRLELTPELHHGDFKSRFTNSEAMLVMKQERQRLVFQELKIAAMLGPGQMFVMTCLSEKPGSIGHYFFTQIDGEKPVLKLYVIRVAQAGPDRSFWEAPPTDGGDVSSDLPE
jgi:hypothetical protein